MTAPTKIWSFEDPFNDPKTMDALIEEADEGGNSWKIVLEERLSEHKDRCDRWKAEIENLLVFAGLFSAVVTTFVVDSYKNIDPDPQDTTVQLLAQLVSHLVPGHNNSISTAPIPPSTPNQSQIRVNALWFLSLVLSLGTAVGGITVLQWLRSFQQYDRNLTYRQCFALTSLRDQSLEDWKVAAFIATLPFVLQLALALFLIGLSDFLFNTVSHTIAIPCIVVSAIIIIFLVASIMLPTLQYVVLRIGLFKRWIPTPCPYRSPPGWAFLRLAQWIVAISGLRQIILHFSKLKTAATALDLRLRRRRRALSCARYGQYPQRPGRDPDEVGIYSNLEWIRTDLNWLLARSKSYASSASFPQSENRNTFPRQQGNYNRDDDYIEAYDAANGLSSMQDYTFRSSAAPYVLYSCFRDLPSQIIQSSEHWRHVMEGRDGQPLVQVQMLYGSDDVGGELGIISKAEEDIMFLEWLEETKKKQLGPGITERQVELFVRLMGAVFHVSPASPILKLHPNDPNLHREMWLPSTISDMRINSSCSTRFGAAAKKQILLIFDGFITSSRRHNALAEINHYHTRAQTDPFTRIAVLFIEEAAIDQKDPLHEVIETLGPQINENIERFLMDDLLPNQEDYLKHLPISGWGTGTYYRFPALYYLSCLYIRYLVIKGHHSRDKLCSRAPEFGRSLVDLANTWLNVLEEIGIERLDDSDFFQELPFSNQAWAVKAWLGIVESGEGGGRSPTPEDAEGSTRTRAQTPESGGGGVFDREDQADVKQFDGHSTRDAADVV